MSEEIKLEESSVEERITELQSSIQGLDLSFFEAIESLKETDRNVASNFQIAKY